MKPRLRNIAVFFIFLFNPFFAFGEWPSFRGAKGDGTADSGARFASDPAGSLKVAWSVPAGSGYSSVSIADGVAVTLFSDGKSDQLAAFDEKTGKELWRTVMGETYKGHDGSHDGPIATPAIADGKVFAIAPRGEFIAADLRTGKKIWEMNLLQSEGAEKPIAGDMIGARQEQPMNRVPETDLFWYHVELEPDAMITYRFVKNYEEQVADPKNVKKTKDGRGEDLSYLRCLAGKTVLFRLKLR